MLDHDVHGYSMHLRVAGRFALTLSPKWLNLVVAVLSAVLGWLSTLIVPVPGSSAAGPSSVVERMGGK